MTTNSDIIVEPQLPSAVATAVPAVTSDLRFGWKEVQDNASGRPYYYNESTGEATWTMPVPPTTSVPSQVKPVHQSHQPIQSTSGVPVGRTSGKAIASMVCGIVGILIFGIVLGPIAICLGICAKNEINENPGVISGTCQANAGISCGFVAILIWIIVVAMLFS